MARSGLRHLGVMAVVAAIAQKQRSKMHIRTNRLYVPGVVKYGQTATHSGVEGSSVAAK